MQDSLYIFLHLPDIPVFHMRRSTFSDSPQVLYWSVHSDKYGFSPHSRHLRNTQVPVPDILRPVSHSPDCLRVTLYWHYWLLSVVPLLFRQVHFFFAVSTCTLPPPLRKIIRYISSTCVFLCLPNFLY